MVHQLTVAALKPRMQLLLQSLCPADSSARCMQDSMNTSAPNWQLRGTAVKLNCRSGDNLRNIYLFIYLLLTQLEADITSPAQEWHATIQQSTDAL